MKIFGWVLIVMFILYTILPLHYYTEQVFVEGSPKVIEYYTFDEDGKMNVHKSELPNISVVERTQRTWFILSLSLEVWKDPARGMGMAIGWIGMLVLGIWLIKRKKSVAAK